MKPRTVCTTLPWMVLIPWALVAGCNTSTDVSETKQALSGTSVCAGADEGSNISVSCSSGEAIEAIEFASYGSPAGNCGNFVTGSCHAAGSLDAVRDACVGKTSCTVSASNAVFGDPCVGVDKRLDVQAACSSGRVCGTVEELSSMALSCPPGQSIASVVFASYGSPTGECGAFAITGCHAAGSAEVLARACVGKAACTVPAANAVFGDPCAGVDKRLSVEVECQPDPSGGAGTDPGGGSGDSGVPTTGTPTLGGCPVFPSDNEWNRDISADPVDPNSTNYIANINANGATSLHADFGSNPDYGIPYAVVSSSQPKVPVAFDYAGESDPGPYPIPYPNPPLEVSGDHHVIVIDRDNCQLYETWDSRYVGPGWECGSGAIFDLRSNALRPDGWTSGDAAGLPIFPGLVRAEEVAAGAIRHALRFTVVKTQRAYVWPARHSASRISDPAYPPLGIRLRLKSSYDLANVSGASRVILTALKQYGMFLADNGQNWFVSGTSDPSFDDDDLVQLRSVPGTAFEVIESGPIQY